MLQNLSAKLSAYGQKFRISMKKVNNLDPNKNECIFTILMKKNLTTMRQGKGIDTWKVVSHDLTTKFKAHCFRLFSRFTKN